MHPNHIKQINDQKVTSLIQAGIGRAFHSRVLSAEPGTEKLCVWVRDRAREEVLREGKGWIIAGGGIAAHDTMLLLARALHLSQIKTRVLPLARLVSLQDHNSPDLGSVCEVEALFITNFYQSYGAKTIPLTGWQIMQIETLISDRLDEKQAIFLQVAEWGGPTWWSEGLLQRVARDCHLHMVPK